MRPYTSGDIKDLARDLCSGDELTAGLEVNRRLREIGNSTRTGTAVSGEESM